MGPHGIVLCRSLPKDAGSSPAPSTTPDTRSVYRRGIATRMDYNRMERTRCPPEQIRLPLGE
jgi:hypothetical protein